MPIYESIDNFSVHCPTGRLLGIDVGEKTLGLALSDVTRLVSTPLLTLRRKKWTQDVVQLMHLMEIHVIFGIIVGWPLNMNGTQGPRCQSTRQFAENLLQIKDFPLCFWDERLSTVAVTKAFLEADLSRQKRDEKVDHVAAAYILQGALNCLRK